MIWTSICMDRSGYSLSKGTAYKISVLCPLLSVYSQSCTKNCRSLSGFPLNFYFTLCKSADYFRPRRDMKISSGHVSSSFSYIQFLHWSNLGRHSDVLNHIALFIDMFPLYNVRIIFTDRKPTFIH